MTKEGTSPESERVFCSHCNSELEPGTNFCASCGQQIDVQTTPSASAGDIPQRALPIADLGQLLGKTIALIKQRPILFIGLGVLPELTFIVLGLLFSFPTFPDRFYVPFGPEAPPPALPPLDASFIFSLVVLMVAGLLLILLSQSAIIYVTARQELGSYPRLSVILPRALRKLPYLFLGMICLVITFFLAILPVILLAFLIDFAAILVIPLIPFLGVVFWFYPEAIVIESQGPISALTRSWNVVKGDRWRVFGVGVVYMAIIVAALIAVSLVAIPLGFISEFISQALLTVVNGLATAWVYIGSTLLYLDLRSRKEGYTRQNLAAELGEPTSSGPAF